MGLNQGQFLLSRGQRAMSGDMADDHNGGGVPGTRNTANHLQCTGQQRRLQPKESTVPRVESPDFNQSQNNIIVKMEPVLYLLPVELLFSPG